MSTPKRQRGAAKGAVTKTIKVLNDLVSAKETSARLQEGLVQLDAVLETFQAVHRTYHLALEDEDDIDASNVYEAAVLGEVRVARQKVQNRLDADQSDGNSNADNGEKPKVEEQENTESLKNAEKPAIAEKQEKKLQQTEPSSHAELEAAWRRTEKLFDMQNTLQAQLSYAKLQITNSPKFSGDPLKFPEFMRHFDSLIQKTAMDEEEKLLCLHSMCEGEAKDAITHCLYAPQGKGYNEMIDILTRRFGHPYRVSEAWIEKVLSFERVKTKEEQRQYLDILRCCQDTLRSIYCEEEVSRRTLASMVEKLPYELKKKWLAENYRLTEGQRRKPTLRDVIRVIEPEIEMKFDPVFGKTLDSNSNYDNKKRDTFTKTKDQKKSTFNTVAVPDSTSYVRNSDTPGRKASRSKSDQLQCYLCKGNHYLNQCDDFRAMDVKDRVKLVQNQNLCQNCFMRGHEAAQCSRSWRCKVCSLKHNTWLHSASAPPVPSFVSQAEPSVQANAVQDTTGKSSVLSKKVVMPIVPVVVSHPKSKENFHCLALLDSGSNATFCSREIVQNLNLSKRNTSIHLNTLQLEGSEVVTTLVDFKIEDRKHVNSFHLKDVLVLDHLTVGIDAMADEADVKKWAHLTGLKLDFPAFDDTERVHVLIGMDNPQILAPQDTKLGAPGEPFAALSGLGWTVNGPVQVGPTSVCSNFCECVELSQQVERFWEVENISSVGSSLSVNDRKVIDLWDSEVVQHDGHYVVPIPFKDIRFFPDNYGVALHRLNQLKYRFKRDPGLLGKYATSIKDSVGKGYMEEVTEQSSKSAMIWYIPHHPVFHPRKPDKVRVVFDCGAKYQDVCLNERVHQGPDLINNLMGVLLRFRQEPIAVCADIEGMYCQVQVPQEQRDSLRFLWWRDNDPTQPVVIYRLCYHLFGGIWCPSAANYALRRVVSDYGSAFSEVAQSTVLNNFYMDDCLKAVDSGKAARLLVEELSTLLSKGGFKLNKWLSNSKEVMQAIPEELWASSVQQLNLNEAPLPASRTLGVLWDVESDTFTYKVQILEKASTKRGMLATLSSIYDPMGFIAPFVVKAKMLFQELTRRRVDWDDPMHPNELEAWEKWVSELPHLSNLSIPRCLKPAEAGLWPDAHLHVFADASEKAYGAVAYLVTAGDAKIVMAKSRLTPVKVLSIPRLELLAAVVATEIARFVVSQFDIVLSGIVYWSDSLIVLYYLRSSDRRFKTFVANRVHRILSVSTTSQWKHVPGVLNPADMISRGLSVSDLMLNEVWFHGPEFLNSEQEWPVQPMDFEQPTDAELKVEKFNFKAQIHPPTVEFFDNLFFRYSNWHCLKRAIAIFLCFKRYMQKMNACFPLSVEGLFDAEISILRLVQCAIDGKKIVKLRPFVEECTGLLRVGGRLEKSTEIPYDAKHPIILPGNHHVTVLIVTFYHQLLGHGGMERVLCEIRQKFWIIRGKSVVQRILSQCVKCKRWKAKPATQLMADLPASRIQAEEPPFCRVGVDYFGPFLVKRNRSVVKRYGCLFVCLSVKAIHLEVSFDLSTDSFLNALQRFISRRGKPAEIRSDNGTNFVGGKNELRAAVSEWNQGKIADHLLQQNIQWIFNPPGASHMGGIWERHIRTVRSILIALFQQQQVDEESLATVFCCAESIVNGRPLTKLSDDPDDLSPLTPNHLLLLRSGPEVPPGSFVKQDVYRRRWRQVQYLADVFWSRWKKEYLPTLQQRQKWFQEVDNLKVGDVVLMVSDSMPRNQWCLGRVVQVFPGADGKVRTVQLKTQNGLLVRPIQKLCLLECV